MSRCVIASAPPLVFDDSTRLGSVVDRARAYSSRFAPARMCGGRPLVAHASRRCVEHAV